MREAPEFASKALKAETSETVLSTVSDVRNLTEVTKHPRFKRKFESTTGLSYKPQTNPASDPTDQGLSTESNSTTHTMHPDVFRKAQLEREHDATRQSRQSTPSSNKSSISSLTLASSEREIFDKDASLTKESLTPVSPKDSKDDISHTENVKGILATVVPGSQPKVSPEDKDCKSRQTSQSQTVSSRVLTRSAARAANATRGQPEDDDLHPEGPRHLEYDVTIALRNFKEAVYAALYDNFRYAPAPLHRRSLVGFNTNLEPGASAVIKADWRVLKAAKTLNEAHKQVRDALAKGETWDNTPIPEEWKGESECLTPLEHLRILCDEPMEPNPVKAKRGRKPPASENMESAASVKQPVLQVDTASESLCKRPRGRPRKIQSAETAASSSTNDAGRTTNESTSVPTEASAPDGIATSESLPSVPAKRSRGRPRKRKLEDIVPSLTSKDVTTNSSAPLRQSKRRRTTL